MLNINDINKRIKQRPPFQMIERVIDWTPGESATGIKNVCINEPYFMGHFPDAPIMPGVLIIESCAQLCSLVFDTEGGNPDIIYVLLKVDNFKFVKPVIPGDQLVITVTKTKIMGPLAVFDAVVKVNDEIRSKGSMTFTMVEKSKIYG
ncbi:MAG: 3-hydroxyacyl-ACP dehydratase FabZ [Acholeplasmatales bacterium]|nr:3-hydroxyacyl-ACP dehydratase FabZ [Acholeplasmatales bacterium]